MYHCMCGQLSSCAGCSWWTGAWGTQACAREASGHAEAWDGNPRRQFWTRKRPLCDSFLHWNGLRLQQEPSQLIALLRQLSGKKQHVMWGTSPSLCITSCHSPLKAKQHASSPELGNLMHHDSPVSNRLDLNKKCIVASCRVEWWVLLRKGCWCHRSFRSFISHFSPSDSTSASFLLVTCCFCILILPFLRVSWWLLDWIWFLCEWQ